MAQYDCPRCQGRYYAGTSGEPLACPYCPRTVAEPPPPVVPALGKAKAHRCHGTLPSLACEVCGRAQVGPEAPDAAEMAVTTGDEPEPPDASELAEAREHLRDALAAGVKLGNDWAKAQDALDALRAAVRRYAKAKLAHDAQERLAAFGAMLDLVPPEAPEAPAPAAEGQG